MKGIAQNRQTQQVSFVYFCAIAISIALSLWFSLSTTVINRDAICYLQSAYTIGVDGLHQAMQICGQAKWPFYSVLIFGVTSITKLSYLASANILDGLFSLISVATFIFLVHMLGGTRRTLWYAAAIILLAHEFNSVREYIIRDHGFWAFYLISIASLIQYFRVRKLSYALLWWSSLAVATLFRIEGAIFLLGLPFVAFLQPTQRLRAYCELNLFSLLLGFMLAAYLSQSAHDVGRLTDIKMQFSQGLQLMVQQFHTAKAGLAAHVLSPYAAKDAGLVLGLLFIAWYLQSVIANLSIVYSGLFIYALVRKVVRFELSDRCVLVAYVLINVLITLSFLVENLFLSKRYLVALSLVFMLWVPFALESLIQQTRLSRFVKASVLALILVYAIGGVLHTGSSKSYLRDAGQWLAANTETQSRIYSNDEQVMYYSRHSGNAIFQETREASHLDAISNGKWKQYDFLAVQLAKDDATNLATVKALGISPVKVFADRQGDQVLIYQVSR